MLNIVWNIWKCWWNETDDEILPVFAQFLWTSNLFSLSHGKLFSVSFQEIINVFSFNKNYKGLRNNYSGTDFCPPKAKLARFSLGFRPVFKVTHKESNLFFYVFNQLFLDDATDPWGVRVERVEM